MRILIAIAALSLMGACDSCVAAPQLPPSKYIDSQDNVSRLLNATVDFVMRDPEDGSWHSFCSGSFVSPTTLSTAGHCIVRRGETPFDESPPEMGDTFHYRMFGSDTVHTAGVSGYDGEHDVAILEIVASEPRQPHFLEMELNNVRVGEPCYVAGNPLFVTFLLTDGIVSRVQRDSGGRIEEIMSNVAIYFGSSGSALVNNSGKLIGIADAIAGRQSYLGMHVPARFVAALMAQSSHR
jgi:S1-C subfamily serine protease